MITHSTKTETVVSKESVSIVSEREDARVIKSKLNKVVDLSISEDDDTGSDPYNSTGHHVAVKIKSTPQD